MPVPGGQWPPRSISLRFLFLLKLCSLLEKVETRDALGLRVWLLRGTLGPGKGARVRARGGGFRETHRADPRRGSLRSLGSFSDAGSLPESEGPDAGSQGVPSLLSEIDEVLGGLELTGSGKVAESPARSPAAHIPLASPKPGPAVQSPALNVGGGGGAGGLARPAGLGLAKPQMRLAIDIGGSTKGPAQGAWNSMGEWSPTTKPSAPQGVQQIPAPDIELIKELGRGSFGSVWLGKWRGIDVAVKELHTCNTDTLEGQKSLSDLYKEADTLSRLHHPTVVTFYGVVTSGMGAHPGTVMEYMCTGSLKRNLPKLKDLGDLKLLTSIALDTARGMEYLHGKNLIHFDLKADNLLCDLRDLTRPVVKVSDLGLAKLKAQTFVSGNMRGTLPWMAPELFPTPPSASSSHNGSSYQADKVTEKVDIYSFGVVLWEIWTGGGTPYKELDLGQIFCGVMNDSLRPAIPPDCHPTWVEIMKVCWATRPADRPPFSYLCQQLEMLLKALSSNASTPKRA